VKPFLFLNIFLWMLMSALAQNKPLNPEDTINFKRSFLLDNKVYSVYNNYINAGLGFAYYDYSPYLNRVIGADYNFRIKHHRLQLGAALTGIRLNNFDHSTVKLGIGAKKENKKSLIGFYFGPMFSSGFKPIIRDTLNGPERYFATGAYLQIHYAYKVKWDYGPALSLQFDWNRYRFVSALRLDLFFSGAYQRKVQEENSENY
jgi:hypothetical protein